MRLSVAIMAVPKREAEARALQAQLEEERRFSEFWPWPVDVIVDPNPGSGCNWPNARTCWQRGVALGSDAHLVLQDDVRLSKDFLGGVAHLHSLFPRNPMMFFQATSTSRTREEGKHWMRSRKDMGMQAHLCPTDVVRSMLPWLEEQEEALISTKVWRRNADDDARIRSYYQLVGLHIMSPLPSLADHRMDMPSVLGHASKTSAGWRNAEWFIGEDQSWASIDWSLGADKPRSF